MELEELRQRMENLEKKFVVINQNGINQNGDKRPKLMMEWCPPKPMEWCPPKAIDLIKIKEFTENLDFN